MSSLRRSTASRRPKLRGHYPRNQYREFAWRSPFKSLADQYGLITLQFHRSQTDYRFAYEMAKRT